MNLKSIVPKKISNAEARRATIGANLYLEYARNLNDFYEVFSRFSKRRTDIDIDILTKITGNQDLSPFRNYDFNIPGIGGIVVKEAIRRIQYTSDKVLSSSYDDQLQVSESIQGWNLDDVISIPRSYAGQDKRSRLILALDGRNWLGGMLRRETELPTFGVEGQGNYLESLESNWDKLDNHSGRTAIDNIRNVISSIYNFPE